LSENQAKQEPYRSKNGFFINVSKKNNPATAETGLPDLLILPSPTVFLTKWAIIHKIPIY